MYESGQMCHSFAVVLSKTLFVLHFNTKPIHCFSHVRPEKTWSWLALLAACLGICVFQYLQKGAHSPLSLSQNEVLVQVNVILLSASSHS